MSMSAEETYDCPGCQHEQIFTLHTSVNALLSPDEKQKIIAGNFFIQNCEHCGAQTSVPYQFLYHDQELKMMGYVFPGYDALELRQTVVNQLDKMSFMPAGYALRAVGSLDDLREKIFIAQAGFDDRLLELVKLEFEKSLMETEAKKTAAMPKMTLARFSLNENAENAASRQLLVFYFENIKKPFCFPFLTDFYNSIKERCAATAEATAPTGKFAVIDHLWAESFPRGQDSPPPNKP